MNRHSPPGRCTHLFRQALKNHEDGAVLATPPVAREDRTAQIHADIQRHRSACGCELASVFMISTIVLFLTYIAFGPANWSAREAVWRGIVWVLSVSVVGKLLGLAYAGLRLHMLRAALRKELRVRHQTNAGSPWP
jgi:hypothetical protein